jgi:multidrug efflux pump subunit AcrA (membrane-fusion protein)
LGQIDNVHIEVILTDQMLNYIETGQRSEIIVDNAQYGSLTAPLSRISPFLNPITHSTEAEIDLANPDGVLKPGMFVTVDIYYGESESATLVPLSALYENPLSGVTGVYVSNDSLNQEPVTVIKGEQEIEFTGPVAFDFVPVEVIARGRMHAGISGVEPGNWVITIGQDLLGGEPGEARVRKVDWNWVEHLQNLQRQDLMLEIINKRQENVIDTTT